jgi:hypothetical protein
VSEPATAERRKVPRRRKVKSLFYRGLAIGSALLVVRFLGVGGPVRDALVATLGTTAVGLLAAAAAWREKHRPRHGAFDGLRPSLASGLYGGLAGGALAGAAVAATYYLRFHGKVSWGLDCQSHHAVRLLADPVDGTLTAAIFVWFSLGGVVMGTLAQVGILAFRVVRLQRVIPGLVAEAGALVGGALGGLAIGAGAGLFFAPDNLPLVPSRLLIIGCAVGGIAFVACVLLYEYDGRLREIGRALVVCVVGPPVTLLAWGAIIRWRPEVFGKAAHLMATCAPRLDHARGGALLGGMMGSIFGLQVGLVLLLESVDRARRATRS